jgi:hypothetical protein
VGYHRKTPADIRAVVVFIVSKKNPWVYFIQVSKSWHPCFNALSIIHAWTLMKTVLCSLYTGKEFVIFRERTSITHTGALNSADTLNSSQRCMRWQECIDTVQDFDRQRHLPATSCSNLVCKKLCHKGCLLIFLLMVCRQLNTGTILTVQLFSLWGIFGASTEPGF